MNTVSAVAEAEAGAEIGLTESARYLTFTLNGEAYALNIFHVTEILEHRHLTVVPMMPDFIRGVINLRGRAVPVIDLAIRFARGSTTIARRTSIIIVHINDPVLEPGQPGAGAATARRNDQGGQDIGILVDTVNKVEAFSPDDIEPPPAFGAGIRADYISGMARRDNDFIIVLDIDHVLSLGDLVETAAAAAHSEMVADRTAGGDTAPAGGTAKPNGGSTVMPSGGTTAKPHGGDPVTSTVGHESSTRPTVEP